MIERAARCLKDGGHALFHGRERLCRSRRLLHSAFWSHGARDIDLPAWWLFLLQTPISRDNGEGRRVFGATTEKMAVGLQKVLLDFLYPVQTLALIRRLERSTSALEQASQKIQNASRNYTSIARELIDRRRGAEDVIMEASDSGAENSNFASETPQRSEFRALLASQGDPGSYEKLWQTYQELLETSGSISAQELLTMIRCLATSKRAVDMERSLALFESVPIDGRQAIHYSYAVSIALSLEDLDTAVAFHEEALTRIQGSVGTSALLCYAVEHQNWTVAIDTWHRFSNDGLLYHTRPDVWSDVEALPLPLLIEKAVSAADFAFPVSGAGQQAPAVKAARYFAIELIRRALSVKGRIFDLAKHQQLVDKVIAIEHNRSTLCILALQQLMSVANETRSFGRQTVHLYRLLRQKPSFRPNFEILDSITLRLCSVRSITGVLMMVEDWRRYSQKIGASAYKAILRALAQAGQAKAVYSLFEEFCADYGRENAKQVHRSLLYVHYARADRQGVVRAFNDLQPNYNISPDIFCHNTVIKTFARADDVEGASYWFNKLCNHMKPNRDTFFTLMSMYGKRGDRETVHQLLRQAQQEGIEPNFPMIDTLVLANINDENIEGAEKLVVDALSMRLEGSRTYMWNILLNAFAMRKDLKKMSQLHRQMQDAGVPSNGLTYAALITCLAIAKQPAQARKIMEKVMPRRGIRRTSLHYAIVMGGYLATKQYDKIFELYKDMLSRNLVPEMSTQNVLLRAAASVDKNEKHINGDAHQIDLIRARQTLDQIVANLDPAELAQLGPRKFLGPYPLDEAFISTYFEHIMFLYGRDAAFHKVSEVYDEYIRTARSFGQHDVETSPSIRMLSALMVAHKRAGNHEEVDRCWYLTLDKIEKLVCKPAADTSGSSWVLPSRRFMVNLPLHHYMTHLADLGRVGDLISVIADLLRAGYDLRNGNWNTYIQCLARSKEPKHNRLAFIVCEEELIQGWPGWQELGHPNSLKTKLRAMTKNNPGLPSRRMPMYLTFVHLAAAVLKNIDVSGRDTELNVLAPRSMDAVRNMPKIDDWEQTTILNRENKNFAAV